MKLTLGLAAALAGCVVASQPTADVYILPNRDSTSPPSISSDVARLIALHRLFPTGSASVNEIPKDADIESVASLLNQFGKPIPSIFDETADEPNQLIIAVTGLTEQQIRDTKEKLNAQPAFTIPDVSSIDPLQWITGFSPTDYDGATKEQECSFDEVINPLEERCWAGRTMFAGYDIQKRPQTLNDVVNSFSRLDSLAKVGEMQTTLFLLPAVNGQPGSKQASGQQQELRRRQAERVLNSFHKAAHAEPTSPAPNKNLRPASKAIPACFDSLDSCISGTGNCSDQGQCLNKYGSTAAGGSACFACHCLSTRTSEDGALTHWAGPTCAKKDISVPFWLFAGFTLLMLGILSLSVTMLYNVGDEKLPGVIGAGVSKSK